MRPERRAIPVWLVLPRRRQPARRADDHGEPVLVMVVVDEDGPAVVDVGVDAALAAVFGG
jgi:hypothetical protein